MNEKLRIIESSWDQRAKTLEKSHPLKTLKTLPKMEGITSGTAKHLKAKGLFYLIKHDKNKIFLRYFFKKPLKYTVSLIRSYLKKPASFSRDGDLFFYGLEDKDAFKKTLLSSSAFPTAISLLNVLREGFLTGAKIRLIIRSAASVLSVSALLWPSTQTLKSSISQRSTTSERRSLKLPIKTPTGKFSSSSRPASYL